MFVLSAWLVVLCVHFVVRARVGVWLPVVIVEVRQPQVRLRSELQPPSSVVLLMQKEVCIFEQAVVMDPLPEARGL